MEIKVGEYCRTKQGYIAKLEHKDNDFLYFDDTIWNNYEESPLLPIEEKLLDGRYIRAKDYITKHSENIKDLIEVNDYVNNEIVVDIGERGVYIGYAGDEEYSRTYIDESEIKTIVTKENFKEMEYKVNE